MSKYYIIFTFLRMEERLQNSKQPRTYQVKKYVPSTFIQKYSFMLIRPPRFTYNHEIINPKRKYKNKFQHSVFHIPFPLSLYTQSGTRYVILYLHGNSSSRYEGFSQLANLPAEVGLACFDFAACGNRTDENYISLGKKESNDVDIAVKFLKQRHFKVAVWGRSMGSVSALLSTQANVLIVDSPFSNLKSLCKELSQTQVPCCCLCFFHCLFPCFFWAVNKDVEEKTGISLGELDIIENINKNSGNKSILFLAAKQDKMINFQHAQKLYKKFEGKNKKILVFDGNHHSDRPFQILNQAYNFIQDALFPEKQLQQIKVDEKKDIKEDNEVGSFSVLKQRLEKAEKPSVQMKLQAKVQVSSKVVQGGQTENFQFLNQIQRQR